jgi:transposase
MEYACKFDIRFMGIAGNQRPSHEAFQRFIKEYLTCSIDDIYKNIMLTIIELDDVNFDDYFLDGTKLEANANKYTFVWKKAIINFREKLYRKIDSLIKDVNEHLDLSYSIKETYNETFLSTICDKLEKETKKNKIEFVYGKGKRKDKLQRFYENCIEYHSKLSEYNIKLGICGNRNSYSKIDNDATFMNTKYDHYNRTGVFKPCYNLQIGVSDEYIMLAEVYQNPGDTKTFIPFMEKYKQMYNRLPLNPVGDAGYGSYDNYFYCKDNGMNLTLKYNYFNKVVNDKKFEKNKYNALNFEKTYNGKRLCPAGYEFDTFIRNEKSKTTVYPKIDQVYECSNCDKCNQKSKCTKAKGNRQIKVNLLQDNFYSEVNKNLTSEKGRDLRKKRSIQVEGTFGVIKQNYQYNRLARRGMTGVRTELLLVCIGFNINKFYNKTLRKTKIAPKALNQSF